LTIPSENSRRSKLWERLTQLPLGVGAAVALANVACSDATTHSDCGSIHGGDTSLITWWRPGDTTAEGAAQQQLIDGFLTCSGGSVVVEVAEGDKERALVASEASEKRLLLVNGMSDIDRLHCTATRGTGLFALHDLHGLRWQDRIPNFLAPYVRPCGGEDRGRLFAVPIGLHTLNRVVLNRTSSAGWEDAQRSPPAFLEWLQERVDAGMPKPIVVPEDVELSYLLVENIMVAVAGDRYRDFWDMTRKTFDRKDIDMAPFEAALDLADDLMPFVEFVPAEVGRTSIDTAMAKVCSGEAALTVQADWTNPADHCGGLVTAPFPGTSSYEVFAFDAFAVDHAADRQDPDNPAFLMPGAPDYAWLKAATSLQVQAAYAKAKHSRVLVRQDAQGNSVALQDVDLFERGVTPLPGLLLAVKHSYFNGFNEVIDAYLRSDSPDEAERARLRTELVTYVHDELCMATTCKDTLIQ
jgi:hypothetical protein